MLVLFRVIVVLTAPVQISLCFFRGRFESEKSLSREIGIVPILHHCLLRLWHIFEAFLGLSLDQ